jgi:hypothetical protein
LIDAPAVLLEPVNLRDCRKTALVRDNLLFRSAVTKV